MTTLIFLNFVLHRNTKYRGTHRAPGAQMNILESTYRLLSRPNIVWIQRKRLITLSTSRSKMVWWNSFHHSGWWTPVCWETAYWALDYNDVGIMANVRPMYFMIHFFSFIQQDLGYNFEIVHGYTIFHSCYGTIDKSMFTNHVYNLC